MTPEQLQKLITEWEEVSGTEYEWEFWRENGPLIMDYLKESLWVIGELK